MTLTYFFASNILLLILGYFIDIVIGDPRWKLHPVRVIGKVITLGEHLLYRLQPKLFLGILLVIFTVILTAGIYTGILYIAWQISPVLYIVIGSLGVWASLSVKDMKVQLEPVSEALEKNDIVTARQKLARVVSRDTENMDEPKVVSSAIETISENFTDAVMSPMFYAVFAGAAGAMVFKAISTLDSMVGYRNEKYARFGMASAVCDDMMGFIPARISIIPIMFGALFRKLSPRAALDTYLRHRRDHKSPNSAHSISAFAGALGVTLGGPTSYGGEIVDKPLIIGGKNSLSVQRISKALSLYEDSAFFAALFVILPVWALGKIFYVSF